MPNPHLFSSEHSEASYDPKLFCIFSQFIGFLRLFDHLIANQKDKINTFIANNIQKFHWFMGVYDFCVFIC